MRQSRIYGTDGKDSGSIFLKDGEKESPGLGISAQVVGYAITLIKRLCGGVSEDSLKLGFESAMAKIEADKMGMSQVPRQRFLSGFEALESKLKRKEAGNLITDSQLDIQFEK